MLPFAASGWLTNISDGGTNTIVSYEYDNAGRRTKRTLQNSTFTVLEYDNASQLTNLWHRQISGGSTNTISRYQYGFDDAGNRTWVKRANGKGDVYKYDATDQLTNVLYEASNPDASPSAWTNAVGYYFDAAGNRTQVVSTVSGTSVYAVNALNQYTSVGGQGLDYDSNGNLYDSGELFMEYDIENRLHYVSRTGGGDTWLYYDGLGRVAGQDGFNLASFVYDDQWRVIAEYNLDQGGTLSAKYVYGPGIDEVVRMTRNGTNYYYHAAALDTVTEITSTNGTVVERYGYDVYGQPTVFDSAFNPQPSTAIGNRFLFQGREYDHRHGLYNFRYRYYSPTLGRFVQTDPLGDDGGLNLYAFSDSNPANLIDPFGLAPSCPCGKSPEFSGAKYAMCFGVCMLTGGETGMAGIGAGFLAANAAAKYGSGNDRKMAQKYLRRVATKMIIRGGAKLIPGLGAGLIAADAVICGVKCKEEALTCPQH